MEDEESGVIRLSEEDVAILDKIIAMTGETYEEALIKALEERIERVKKRDEEGQVSTDARCSEK